MDNPLKNLKTISLLLFFLLSFNAYSEGKCVEGNCFNGHGLYEHYVGDSYDRYGYTYMGGFVDGKKHGEGVIVWLTDGKYTGGFANDKKHGKGVEEIWGAIRTGHYVNGEMYGKWSHTRDGSTYRYDYHLGGKSFDTVEEWEKEVEVKEKKEREMERIERLAREKKEREQVVRIAREKKERLAREAREKKERLTREIYDGKYSACVLDKGSSVDMSVKMMRDAIHNVCSAIAEK
jgi:hypothetical protein